MANVIHRTMLQFIPSVNTPDFPEPTWKHSPDMSAVASVPQKYWKAPVDWDAVGAGPVEMSAGEKTAADAAILAAHTAAQQVNRIAQGVGFRALVSADQASSVVTYADVPGLFFPIQPNHAYTFRFFLMFTTAVNTTGLGLQLTGPASPTFLRYAAEIATSATALSRFSGTAFGTSMQAGASAGATAIVARVEGYLLNGASAGDLVLQFRSEVAASAVTIRLGSYGEIR